MTPESLEGLSGPEAAATALEWAIWNAGMPIVDIQGIKAKAAELRAHKTPAQEPVELPFALPVYVDPIKGADNENHYVLRSATDEAICLFANSTFAERAAIVGCINARPAAMSEALGLLREALPICKHAYRENVADRIAAFLKAHGGEHE